MGLVALLIRNILKFIKIKEHYKSIIVILFLLGFTIFTGLRPSAVRAFIMITVLMASDIIKRDYDAISSISFAGIILLFANPLYLWDIGFQLSFSIVGGIIAFSDVVKTQNKLFKAFQYSVIAWAASLPLTAYYFYTLTPISIILNIIVIPIMTFVLADCFAVVAVGFVSESLAAFIAGHVVVMLKFISWLCSQFVNLDFLFINTGGMTIIMVIAIYFIYLSILFYNNKIFSRIILGVSIICFAASVFYKTNSFNVEIAMLDVGQGDSFVITTNKNKAFIIDTGGNMNDLGENTGIKKVYPYLKYKGIKYVDCVIISHMHMDHAKGAAELFENIDIGIIASPFYEKGENEYYDLISQKAEEYNVPLKVMKQGDCIELDNDIVLECIYPFRFSKPEDENQKSLIMKLNVGEKVFIFTGDMDKECEQELLASNMDLDCDVLKIAHHGGNNATSSEFIEKTSPDIALISCGRNNIYGHPADETLNTLKENEIETFITAIDQTVILETDGNLIEVKK